MRYGTIKNSLIMRRDKHNEKEVDRNRCYKNTVCDTDFVFSLGRRGIEFKGWNEWIGNQVEFYYDFIFYDFWFLPIFFKTEFKWKKMRYSIFIRDGY